MSSYFYTETAFHHMGDMAFMKGLIDESARIGARGIKYQVLLDYDSFISVKHSMYHEFKKGMFSEAEWREIFRYTVSKDLDIIFMPICTSAFVLLNDSDYTIKYLDIHSVSFYDEEVLKEIKDSGLPIILGFGGRTTAEVDAKLDFFGNQLKVLMVGFQAFPSNVEDLRLGKIKWLREKYSQLKIGYADHSAWDSDHAIRTNEWAYFLGATFFEKHITTAPGVDRWDWQSAIGVEGCAEIIKNLKFFDDEVMRYSEQDFDKIEGKELIYRNRQKVAVATKDLPVGTKLQEGDIVLRMLDSTEGEVDMASLVGKELTKALESGEKIVHEYLK